MNETIDMSNAIQHEKDGAYKVAMNKGSTNMAVSSQWWSRPDDQRFTSLDDLYSFTHQMASESKSAIIDVRDVECRAKSDDPEDLRLVLPGVDTDGQGAAPTHWSFGQLCSLLSSGGHNVPARYLRQLPGQLAAINLQYAFSNFRSEVVKAYVRDNGRSEMRAATGPDYGRIYDHEVVSAVQKIAGNGVGDSHWKVPGVLEWAGDGTVYNPNAAITKQSTTLFASDRDVFMFLVDDKRPIEIGKLPNGDPDLLFRGFYVWNSEVGNRSIGIATFYLRGVCMNRILWGVENFQEFSFRHSKHAPTRFMKEAAPALEDFSNTNTSALLNGINMAREQVVARSDEERAKFLRKRGFGTKTTAAIIETVVDEEGHAPESIWDFVQGITAVARNQGKQDARLSMEREAQRLLDKVA